jgi:hypothetical protein
VEIASDTSSLHGTECETLWEEGYTFNIAELSIKKDPSEKYPFGYGLVLTAGIDSQKNHSLGIFRDEDDAFPFRNTEKFDLP